MSKETEIREHLEKGVLETQPGSKENDLAVKALNDFNRTVSEIDLHKEEFRLKEESAKEEIRLKSEEADNKLIDKRDENELRVKQLDQQEKHDWIDLTIKAVGLFLNTVFCAVIIHNDTTGKPLLSGPGRQVISNVFRKGK